LPKQPFAFPNLVFSCVHLCFSSGVASFYIISVKSLVFTLHTVATAVVHAERAVVNAFGVAFVVVVMVLTALLCFAATSFAGLV
jgi:hypothetical protein